jgi:hypothetical protein
MEQGLLDSFRPEQTETIKHMEVLTFLKAISL